jgi:hypothetical protein
VRADPSAREIHRGFVPAIRELVDFFVRHEPDSPKQAEPIVARADELPFSSRLDAAQLQTVGRLLEEEGIGRVTWTDDPSSPWDIELGLQILRHRRTATFDDFLRVKFGQPPN